MTKLLILSNFPLPELQERHIERICACAAVYGPVVVTDEAAAQRAEIVDSEIVLGTVRRELFLAARSLRWVQAVGAGIDPMLFREFVESDVLLTSEKGLVGTHLAEHAFALLLSLSRGLQLALREPRWETRIAIRAGAWELEGLTLCVVGLGGTGMAVAERARAFGMHVLAVDPEPIPQPSFVEWLRPPQHLPEALGRSDVVVICAPLTPLTRHLFNAERFAELKPGALLIDVTRGEIIERDPLVAALRSGQLGGAGLDTSPGEPLADEDPLWRMENVIVTPHVAGASPRRGDRIVDLFCDNLRRFHDGEPLRGVIDKAKGY
jgi:phosphoglycerate dehydrogenase-like enzyme